MRCSDAESPTCKLHSHSRTARQKFRVQALACLRWRTARLSECEVSIPTRRDSGWVVFRSCLSLLLIWTLICGITAPRVDAAGNWLTELFALLSTPNTEQIDTPTDAVISRTRPTLNSGSIEGNLRVLKAEPFSMGAQTTLTGDLFLAGSASLQSSEAVVDDGGPN